MSLVKFRIIFYWYLITCICFFGYYVWYFPHRILEIRDHVEAQEHFSCQKDSKCRRYFPYSPDADHLNTTMSEGGVWDGKAFGNLQSFLSIIPNRAQIYRESERNRLAGVPPSIWTQTQIYCLRFATSAMQLALGSYFGYWFFNKVVN